MIIVITVNVCFLSCVGVQLMDHVDLMNVFKNLDINGTRDILDNTNYSQIVNDISVVISNQLSAFGKY